MTARTMRGTWEAIWYDAGRDEWRRCVPRATYQEAHAEAARIAGEGGGTSTPTLVKRTRELDTIGLPEGPPLAPRRKGGRRG